MPGEGFRKTIDVHLQVLPGVQRGALRLRDVDPRIGHAAGQHDDHGRSDLRSLAQAIGQGFNHTVYRSAQVKPIEQHILLAQLLLGRAQLRGGLCQLLAARAGAQQIERRLRRAHARRAGIAQLQQLIDLRLGNQATRKQLGRASVVFLGLIAQRHRCAQLRLALRNLFTARAVPEFLQSLPPLLNLRRRAGTTGRQRTPIQLRQQLPGTHRLTLAHRQGNDLFSDCRRELKAVALNGAHSRGPLLTRTAGQPPGQHQRHGAIDTGDAHQRRCHQANHRRATRCRLPDCLAMAWRRAPGGGRLGA